MSIVRQENDELEIDLKEVIVVLVKKLPLILLVSVLCAGIAWGAVHLLITPQYKASVTLYVNNSTGNEKDSSSITSSDLSASAKLVDTYGAIIKSDSVLDRVIASVGIDMDANELRSSLTTGSVNSTEVLSVSVMHPDAVVAADLANAIAEIVPEQIAAIVEGSSVKIIDKAKIPEGIASPSYRSAAILGAFVGFLLTCVIIILRSLIDTTIKSREDLEQWGIPVLSMIPDLADAQKHDYNSYGSYGAASKKKQ